MVKKRPNSLKKTIIREIRDSLGRYLAIVGIIALGSGFFTGLKVTKTAMLETGDRYMRSHGFFDYRLISTLGWDDENVAEISGMDEVRCAEGSVSLDFLALAGSHEFVLKAHSIGNYVNLYDLTVGRMPESADECVLDDYNLSGFSLGDTIQVSPSNDADTLDSFAYKEYKVVGFVRTPMYINFERGNTTIGDGTVSGFVCMLPDGFDTDYYTEIYLTLTDGGYVYSEEYDAALDKAFDPLEAKANEEASARYERIMQDARAELQDARVDYNDGLEKYNDGFASYSDGLDSFLDGKSAYDDGSNELYEQRRSTHEELLGGYYKLVDNSAALDEAEAQLNAFMNGIYAEASGGLSEARGRLEADADVIPEVIYAALSSALDTAQSALDSGTFTLRSEMYPQALSILDSASAYLDEHREGIGETSYLAARRVLDFIRGEFINYFGQLYDAYNQIVSGRGQIAAGWQLWNDSMALAEEEFAKAEDTLAVSRLKLAEAEQELTDAEAELSDGKAELDDAEIQLADAEKTLNELERPEVFLLDRSTNVGYVCFESDSDIVDGIASVFPFFFFAVAALVCITTMNRMVDDERGQIGILKALGYSTGAIMSRYLIYTGSASLIGCAVGVTIGSWLFPTVIWTAYMIMYSMPPITIVCDVGLMLLSSLSYLLLAMLVTWLSCRNELRQPAADLIRPKSPPAGKRIWLEHFGFIWKRLGFLRKVSLRNVFRYRKRLIMMVLGIGGCTALLLTGLGLNDSITHIADRQFDEISIYDASISFTDDMSGAKADEFLAECSDVLTDCAFIYSANVTCTTDTYTGTVTLEALDDFSMLRDLMSFHLDGRDVPAPGEGECIISKNLADRYALNIGESLALTSGDTDSVSLRVSGIFANVIYNYVYANLSAVEELAGSTPELKTAYVNFDPDMDVHEAAAMAAGCSGVANVSVTADMRARVNNMLDSMKYVVLLVIACAGALAFIVLFNLTNINIIERIREIATIKVLGFNTNETAQYVFRENMILTFCGCVVGIPMGIWLHNFVMAQIKIDMISFEARRSLFSYALSTALTFLFTAAVNLFMLPRLEKINMAEALKSVE